MQSSVEAPWQRDKRWSDKFLPIIKRRVGECLVSEAPMEEDKTHNTDLIVLKLDAVRIACRIRKFGYVTRYADEFTIRAVRPGGAETELAKIISGWGDYVFYGMAKEDERGLCAWVLGDLKVFRAWYHQQLRDRGTEPGLLQSNDDGSSKFRAFRIDALPTDFVLARRAYVPDLSI